ncbi:MAG: aspartate-semialdehyde dehydrogenase [SAR324 cluster bacterium]|uniref:aspartate-semialdehyde dehydrogenase n=1 Tax=SAR324 cluster bacterium TaxID=2024889 RepID=A0A7X9FUE0_9DELT|nr:aspartate-semialdehyde dehydrogenase [SAR324 cluster bacterium]
MLRVGIVGWRGMVGSVLINRMREEGDFSWIEPVFFSTSNVGALVPLEEASGCTLKDAYDINELKDLDVILSCQGGDYTKAIYANLRKASWNGYWIDAASTLRMEKDSIIVLDPMNRGVINQALKNGVKTFVGGNCTVSLMIMALSGLLSHEALEWIHSSTYQAASGAGAKHMIELMKQMHFLGNIAADILKEPAATALEIERSVTEAQRSQDIPLEQFPTPLAGNLIPWIDKLVEGGQSREEWKGHVELNKILQNKEEISVDGICVRIGALRCHSQSLLIKLKKDIPIDEINHMISEGNDWVSLVENTPEATFKELHPARISGTLNIPVGRVHKMRMGPQYLGAFTVGDQLLWGAAEPLRRMLRILEEEI